MGKGTRVDIHFAFGLMKLQLGKTGTVLGVHIEKERTFFLVDIAVDRSFRRQGVGSSMLNVVEEVSRCLDIKMIRGNLTEKDLAESAFLPSFFEKKGFEVVEAFSEFAQWGIQKDLSNS